MVSMNEQWRLINVAHPKKVLYLAERWEDERDYEDIKDYEVELQKSIPSVFSMRKRPFGFSIKCTDGTLRVTVKLNKHAEVQGEMIAAGGEQR